MVACPTYQLICLLMDEGNVPQPAERDWLIEFLHDRDVSCPLCGYNLRKLFSDRCPECGREIRLNVLPVELPLRAWIFTIIPLGASAGMGVFVLAIIIQEGWPPARMLLLSIPLVYFLISIPLFAALFFGRRIFLAFKPALQGAFASISLILLILALLLFFAGLGR
jgi:hypothetical protein